MTLRVSGQNLDIGEALRSQIEARVASALGKYFDGTYSGHVTVGRDGTGFRTDCTLHLATGVTLHTTGHAHDAYVAFSESAERIEKRLRRHKRRLKAHGPGGSMLDESSGAGAARANGRADLPRDAQYAILAGPDDDEELTAEFQPMVVAESILTLKELAVSAAVAELDLSGAPFLLFRHAVTGRFNVVYRRPDGHFGWVDPPAG